MDRNISFFEFFPPLLEASLVTVEITLLAAVLGLALAMTAGLGRLSRVWTVRAAARVYVEFFRGTSALVQLFWLFFVLPHFGIFLEPITVGVVGLGLNVGAYGAEVVRGSILAVDKGQFEAATSLNMTRMQSMRRVILPQALVSMMPPFGNLFIELLKSTALVSLITITDVTFRGAQLNVLTLRSTEIFGIVLNIYFLMALVIIFFMRNVERRLSAHIGRVEVR
jgi:polar amino acid transport system permease protein